MVVFLLSHIGCYVKIDGVRTPKVIDDTNGLVKNLKKSLKHTRNLLYVASDPTGYDDTLEHAIMTQKGLELSGVNFENVFILDDKTKSQAKEMVKNADLIFLTGGPLVTQNNFFKEIDLKQLLRNFDGVIMGQSAGSMNMAKTVYNYPETLEELDIVKYTEGLGVVDINIIPHYEPVSGNLLVSEDIDFMNDYLKKDSFNSQLYGLIDGSYIMISQGKKKAYGDIYLIYKGNVSKICEKGKSVLI